MCSGDFNTDLGLSMPPVMTSVSQKRHIIHDSGGCFDPRFRHTNIENHLVNDSIAVRNMPFTTSDEESLCMTECDDNATSRDGNIETSLETSLKSEVDFEFLVSEMSHNNEDSTVNTNKYSDYFLETLTKDIDITTNNQTEGVTDLAESTGCYKWEENVPQNSVTGDKYFENGLSGQQKHSKTIPAIDRILQQTIVDTDHINNNDRFPKRQTIFEQGRSSTESDKNENGRNDGNLNKSMRKQERDADAINIYCDVDYTYDDVIHSHDNASDCSDGYEELKKRETNTNLKNSNDLNGSTDLDNRCINDMTDQVLQLSSESETRSEEDFATSVFSTRSRCLVDKDSNESSITESRMKAMFINNWSQGLPQTGHISNLQLPEVWDEVSDTLQSKTNADCQINCTDDSTFVGSDCCTPVSLDLSETTCPFSSVGEMPHLLRNDSCSSISSLSTLSISDFLLGTSSKSSSPSASFDDMAAKDICQSRNSSSPILKNTHLEQSGDECSEPIFADVTIVYPESESSRKSSVSMSVDSRPSSPSMKSSNADRRISNGSDISSISLSGSLLSCSPDPTEDTDRTDTPSPSPFGHQLKYFQDKRKNEMFLVKTTTARLGLNTRRKSYSLWREDNLDTKGRPLLKKPKINIGQKSDVFTKERVAAINMAMDWVREELHQLREQDESLAHQFLEIRRTIHELKLDWSCESHREMLMNAEDEIDKIKTLKRVSDLPEHHTLDGILRDKSMTRRRLGNRKYSIF